MTTATTPLPGSNSVTGSNAISNAAGRAHQMVDNVADKATPAVQSATFKAHDTIDKVAPAVQAATIKAHDTIDKVASASSAAADWATANGTQLADKSSALAEACTGYVRERPLVSVAGALAIGYFVGRVMR
jgi:ElaB/YqjD/DUF883 family membrane-anchored ribosome-binding protein